MRFTFFLRHRRSVTARGSKKKEILRPGRAAKLWADGLNINRHEVIKEPPYLVD